MKFVIFILSITLIGSVMTMEKGHRRRHRSTTEAPCMGQSCDPVDPKLQEVITALTGDLHLAEKTFSFFLERQYTHKITIAREFKNSIDLIVRQACQELHTGKGIRLTVISHSTAIDLMCVQLNDHIQNPKNATNIWSFRINDTRDSYGYIDMETTTPAELFPSDFWVPCEVVNKTRKNVPNSEINCYATVRHKRCDGNSSLYEGLWVTTRNNKLVEGKGSTDDDLDNPENGPLYQTDGIIEQQLKKTAGTCTVLNKTLEDQNETDSTSMTLNPAGPTCEFFLEEKQRNSSEDFQCACTDTGFYREIFVDDEPEVNHHVILEDNERAISFWINFKYNEKNRTVRNLFENSLLDQILNTTWPTVPWRPDDLKLSLIPGNNTFTLLVLTFAETSMNKSYDRNDWYHLLSSLINLERLTLIDTGNRTLIIPSHYPFQNNYGEASEYVDSSSAAQGRDSVFLWFVFAVVILITIALVTIAIRKHQRESEDSVEPMSFQPEDLGLSEGQCPRRCGNNGQGIVASARSMTTILSESSDGGSIEDDDVVQHISAGTVGIGIRSFEHAESPRPVPSAFRVSSASHPVLVTDEDELERIYYLPPPADGEETHSAFP